MQLTVTRCRGALHDCPGSGYSSPPSRGSGMKPQFRLKACPRCGGDLARDRDEYGDYDRCFQCGYVADLAITDQPTCRLSWARNLPRSETTRVARAMNRLVAITMVASVLALWLLAFLFVWMLQVTLGRLSWRNQPSKSNRREFPAHKLR